MTCCDTEVKPSQFHCAACCQTFGSLALFDHHQYVKYSPPVRLACKNPVNMRGVVNDNGVWRTQEKAAAIRERMDKMRKGRKKAL